MTSATDPHPDLLAEPSARTFPLAQLVSLIREGKVRIPHFQRGLRWGTPDAVALIDSVLREFYDRTNNAGKRLTRAAAFHEGHHFRDHPGRYPRSPQTGPARSGRHSARLGPGMYRDARVDS